LSTDTNARLLSVEPLPQYEPTIGRWLWLLEETRRETKEALENLSPAALDWTPAPGDNSIGTLLYHIELIELDWLFTEVLERQPWPQELKELFAISARDDQGRLSSVRGVTLEEHIQRLDFVREHLLASFRTMSLQEFRCPHAFPDYHVTAEWVLHHLIQHEVEHRGHIQMLRSLAQRALESL
jgi:uncharacterized damage-inducible protein DinB